MIRSRAQDAKITILPDLPPPVHPTPLETLLIDRALHDHWEHLRVFLLDSHGGLLRSAVRAFNGVKLSKFDLLSVCDDTRAVMLALDRSKKNPSGASSSSFFCSAGSCAVADALLVRRFGPRLAERFLPYDPAISQIRNAWRQQAYYDKTADLVVWSAATTHFLEISALHPDFALGVVSSSFSLSLPFLRSSFSCSPGLLYGYLRTFYIRTAETDSARPPPAEPPSRTRGSSRRQGGRQRRSCHAALSLSVARCTSLLHGTPSRASSVALRATREQCRLSSARAPLLALAEPTSLSSARTLSRGRDEQDELK